MATSLIDFPKLLPVILKYGRYYDRWNKKTLIQKHKQYDAYFEEVETLLQKRIKRILYPLSIFIEMIMNNGLMEHSVTSSLDMYKNAKCHKMKRKNKRLCISELKKITKFTASA